MAYSDPRSIEEFTKRYEMNLTATGGQFSDVVLHFPCPFCAADGWMGMRLAELGMASPTQKCEECGRTARIQSTQNRNGGFGVELVIVHGENPPFYLQSNAGVKRVVA